MTNGLRPKVEQDLFHLYDFTIRKKNALKKVSDQYPIFCVAKFTTQKCCPGSTICKLLSSIYICLMLFATWRHILFVYSATACLFLPTNFRSCQRLIAMTPKYFLWTSHYFQYLSSIEANTSIKWYWKRSTDYYRNRCS